MEIFFRDRFRNLFQQFLQKTRKSLFLPFKSIPPGIDSETLLEIAPGVSTKIPYGGPFMNSYQNCLMHFFKNCLGCFRQPSIDSHRIHGSKKSFIKQSNDFFQKFIKRFLGNFRIIVVKRLLQRLLFSFSSVIPAGISLGITLCVFSGFLLSGKHIRIFSPFQ